MKPWDGPDSFLEALASRGIVFLAGSSESQVPLAPGRRAGRRRQRKICQKVHCPLRNSSCHEMQFARHWRLLECRVPLAPAVLKYGLLGREHRKHDPSGSWQVSLPSAVCRTRAEDESAAEEAEKIHSWCVVRGRIIKGKGVTKRNSERENNTMSFNRKACGMKDRGLYISLAWQSERPGDTSALQ